METVDVDAAHEIMDAGRDRYRRRLRIDREVVDDLFTQLVQAVVPDIFRKRRHVKVDLVSEGMIMQHLMDFP